MALRRTSVAMQNQILELRRQGKGIRKIAQALGLARNTVRACLCNREASNQSYQGS